MNKTATKGNISKHIEEMLSQSKTFTKPRNSSSPEKTLNPPKPIPPPQIFSEPEPGKIVSTVVKPAKNEPIYSLFSSKSFKILSLEPFFQKITSFIQGGSRAEWLCSIKMIIKQSAIPLVKEILYNKNKTLEAKKIFKKELKEYLFIRNKEKRSLSPIKPPFLSSSKTPLNESKHKACIQAKEDNFKQKNSNVEEIRCKVLLLMNNANFELCRTVLLIFQLVCFLANSRNEHITDGERKRKENLCKKIMKD